MTVVIGADDGLGISVIRFAMRASLLYWLFTLAQSCAQGSRVASKGSIVFRGILVFTTNWGICFRSNSNLSSSNRWSSGTVLTRNEANGYPSICTDAFAALPHTPVTEADARERTLIRLIGGNAAAAIAFSCAYSENIRHLCARCVRESSREHARDVDGSSGAPKGAVIRVGALVATGASLNPISRPYSVERSGFNSDCPYTGAGHGPRLA